MSDRRYLQEEYRMYITENKYLLMCFRYGNAKDNNMLPDDFARNIWLMEEGHVIWRVSSDADWQGESFCEIYTTNSEYIAIREGEYDKYDNKTWELDIATGNARRYPDTKDPFAGKKKHLYIKQETRIYLNDESYILLVTFPGCINRPRNICRISATGEEMWRISVRPEIDDNPINVYSYLRLLDDGTVVAVIDERKQYSIDIETGKGTYGLFV